MPFFKHLSEYKALEGEEARRAASSKFVKRKKERLYEKEASEDGMSTTSPKPRRTKKTKTKTARTEGTANESVIVTTATMIGEGSRP